MKKDKSVEKVRQLLKSEYEKIRIKKPQFSLRSFAAKLEVSPGALSEVMNGKRNPSARLVHNLYHYLGKSSDEYALSTKEISALGFKVKKSDRYIQNMEEDQFKLISGWHHWALLFLIETHDFKYDIAWIAMRLGITEDTVSESLERLKLLGLVKELKNGTLVTTKEGFKASDDFANSAVRQAHLSDLDLVQKHMNSDIPVPHNDFTSCTYAVNVQKIDKLKRLIRRFHDQVAQLVEDSKSSEVFRMSIYFYPLTKIVTDKKNN